MLVFTTALDEIQIVIKDIEEVAILFASSFGRTKLCENKKECFLEFTKENQLQWCKTNFNKNNIHLLKSAILVNKDKVA
jgi:hypothetical protein